MRGHIEKPATIGSYCDSCGLTWPCDAVQMEALARELAGALTWVERTLAEARRSGMAIMPEGEEWLDEQVQPLIRRPDIAALLAVAGEDETR